MALLRLLHERKQHVPSSVLISLFHMNAILGILVERIYEEQETSAELL